MAENVKTVVIGGYFGSGKTMLVESLAKYYRENHIVPYLVVNELGESAVVDMNYLGNADMYIDAITGGSLSDIPEKSAFVLGKYKRKGAERIIVEMPGSEVGTLERLIGGVQGVEDNEADFAPYVVVVDPVRAELLMAGDADGNYAADALWTVDAQLKEANLILLSKSDTVDPDALAKLEAYLAETYGKPVMAFSAREGQGIAEVADRLSAEDAVADVAAGSIGVDSAEMDRMARDTVLFNEKLSLRSDAEAAHDLNKVGAFLAARIKEGLEAVECNTEHLKLYLQGSKGYFTMNVPIGVHDHALHSAVAGADAAAVDSANDNYPDAMVVISAHVLGDPIDVQAAVDGAVAKTCEEFGFGNRVYFCECWTLEQHRHRTVTFAHFD